MPDLYRHDLKDVEFGNKFEKSVEIIKAEINERINEIELICAELPIPPRLCYFANQDDIDIDLNYGERPLPRPEQTVIVIAEHPEYRAYFKAIFAWEAAGAALKMANRIFQKDRDRPKKKRVKEK